MLPNRGTDAVWQILEPLSAEFGGLVKAAASPRLPDILDCFAGVADAAQPQSAHFLFRKGPYSFTKLSFVL